MIKLNVCLLAASFIVILATAEPVFAVDSTRQNPRSQQAYQDDQDNDDGDEDDVAEAPRACCYKYDHRDLCDCEDAAVNQPGLYEFQQTVSWPGRNSETSDRLTGDRW